MGPGWILEKVISGGQTAQAVVQSGRRMGSPHLRPVVSRIWPIAKGEKYTQFGQTVTVDSPRAVVVELRGGATILDEDDLQYLLRRRWNVRPHRRTAYVVYHGRQEAARLHRLLLGAGDKRLRLPEVDHRNGAGWDNRRKNLRLANGRNGQNMRIRQGKRGSQYKGVTFDAKKQLYRARIMVNRRSIGLGRFKNEVAAACAYDMAAREHFGEYAVLNFGDN